MGNGDTSFVKGRMGWVEQRRIIILECEILINKLAPCSPEKIVAEIEYKTGLSNQKAKEAMNIFLQRGIIKIESDKKTNDKIVVLVK